MQERNPPKRRRVVWLLISLLASGCATSNIKPTDKAEPWTKPWRPRADTTSGFGVDSRAREIERNLGVY